MTEKESLMSTEIKLNEECLYIVQNPLNKQVFKFASVLQAVTWCRSMGFQYSFAF